MPTTDPEPEVPAAEWPEILRARGAAVDTTGGLCVGPIRWTPWDGMSRDAVEAVCEALVTAAGIAEANAPSLLGRVLPVPAVAPAPAGLPGGCVVLDRGDLCVQQRFEGWITSHRTGLVTTEVGRVPRAAVPRSPAALRVLVETLAAAASRMGERPPRTCRYCGLTGMSLHFHDRTTCHGCAERHLGVLH